MPCQCSAVDSCSELLTRSETVSPSRQSRVRCQQRAVHRFQPGRGDRSGSPAVRRCRHESSCRAIRNGMHRVDVLRGQATGRAAAPAMASVLVTKRRRAGSSRHLSAPRPGVLPSTRWMIGQASSVPCPGTMSPVQPENRAGWARAASRPRRQGGVRSVRGLRRDPPRIDVQAAGVRGFLQGETSALQRRTKRCCNSSSP